MSTEDAARRTEAPRPEETGRALIEQSRMYPIEGEDLIAALYEAEVGEKGDISELSKAVDETLSFKEGLRFGPEGEDIYNLDDPNVLGYLYNLFTTAETSTDRPNTYYLDAALKDVLSRKAREAKRWHSDPARWETRLLRKLARENKLRMEEGKRPLGEEETVLRLEEERRKVKNVYDAIPRLQSLENRVESRELLDKAFIQRMGTCEDPASAGNLLKGDRRYQPPVTPDRNHWRAFFQGNSKGDWGFEVNKTFWEIVAMGLPEGELQRLGRTSPLVEGISAKTYANGFENTADFKTWLSYLLKSANGRMDVVWAAWRLVQTWEVYTQLAISETKDGYEIAVPPLANALLSWTIHLEQQRRKELGLKHDNTRVSGQVGKYVTHSGLPMSLDKFGPICLSFPDESNVKFGRAELDERATTRENLRNRLPSEDKEELEAVLRGEKDALTEKPKQLKISLFALGLYGGLSFSDPLFPWALTEEIVPGSTPAEQTPGSFSGWLLKRSRCLSSGERGSSGVLADIRLRPRLEELGDPDFFAGRVRTWDKVLDPVKDVPPGHPLYLKPEDNPRNWWLAGILFYHFPGESQRKVSATDEEKYRDYRTAQQSQGIETDKRAGSKDVRGVGAGDVLRNALACGFVRQADSDFICSLLGIRGIT